MPSAQDLPFKVGAKIARRYELKDAVGSGPLGFTYRALDQSLGVEVLLKAIAPSLLPNDAARRGFAKQMKAMKRLAHPHVAKIYDEGLVSGPPPVAYVTSQLLYGLSLRQILEMRAAKGQVFGLREIEPIFGQLAEALEYAHDLGAHGGLKPENVLVLPDLLKVTDFGYTRALPREAFVGAQRANGSDRYLAPEVIAGGEIELRSDIYSLGVMLGEMLAGVFPGKQAPELRGLNPEVTLEVEQIYRRAVERDPNARFPRASDFAGELASAARNAPRASAPEPRRSPARGIPAERSRSVPEPARLTTEPMAISTGEYQLLGDEGPTLVRRGNEAKSGSAADAKTRLIPYPDDEDTPTPTPTSSSPEEGATPPPPRPELPRSTEMPTVAVEVPTLETRQLELGAQRRRSGSPWGWAAFLLLAGIAALAVGHPALRARLTGAFAGSHDDKNLFTTPVVGQPDPPAASPLPSPSPGPPAPAPNGTAKGAGGPCPPGMAHVPAGPARLGADAGDPMRNFGDREVRSVVVPAFCIDLFEHPNRRGAMPTTQVTWADAERTCKEQGKRLCGEDEWEKACKGPGNLRFPYGEAFDPAACNTRDQKGANRMVAAAGNSERCRSGYGVLDLSGNVAEWTASRFLASAADRTKRGGAANRPDFDARCSARANEPPGSKGALLGFRCCTDPR
jgi:serine/threonine protein kinase/formylglycine-generating enzyme required for sulfatase activity